MSKYDKIIEIKLLITIIIDVIVLVSFNNKKVHAETPKMID